MLDVPIVASNSDAPFFHIDIAEVRTEQGKLHMFVALDRTSKFAYVELHENATTAVFKGVPAAPDRSRSLQDPYRAHRQRHPVPNPPAPEARPCR